MCDSIKFPIAKNQNGDLVKIADANKTDQYICVACEKDVFPVNIDKTEYIQEPHFRHYEQNIDCH